MPFRSLRSWGMVGRVRFESVMLHTILLPLQLLSLEAALVQLFGLEAAFMQLHAAEAVLQHIAVINLAARLLTR